MKRSHGQLFRAGGRKGKIYKMAGLPSTAPTTAERSEGDGRPREKARPGREAERAFPPGAPGTSRAWLMAGAQPTLLHKCRNDSPRLVGEHGHGRPAFPRASLLHPAAESCTCSLSALIPKWRHL